MASKTITFRFPEEIIEAIEARAKAAGSNRTAVLMEALAKAYGFPSPSPAPVSTEALQLRLHGLEQQVVTLLEQLAESIREVKELSSVAVRTGQRGGGHATGQVSQSDASGFDGDPVDERSQLLAQLQHQARMLDQILSATPDMVFVQDRRGRFTYVNPAGARVFGCEQSYFLGKTCQDLGFSDDTRKPFSANREIVFTTGRPVSSEMCIPSNHETRNYEYILSPVHGINGSIDAVVCTARDITERKRTEAALRESEEEYRNLFELANDSIFIIDASSDLILNANRNAARRLGYTRRELLQLRFGNLELPTSELRKDSLIAELQRAGSVIYEHTLRRKDGTDMPVEISSRLIEYGDILAIQSFVRDITDRKKVETRLRLLESAILSADDAILITEATPVNEPGPKIVHVNESFVRMTGYRPEEVIGRTPRLLQGPKTDRAQLDKIRIAMAKLQPVRVEIINYRKDGSEFWLELTLAPIANADNRYTHWIGVQRDITERKRLEEGL